MSKLPVNSLKKGTIRIGCSTLLLFTALQVCAQTPKQILKYADKLYASHEYYGASKYYKQLLDEDDRNIELMHKYADCLRLYNEYEKAEKIYKKIYKADRGRTYPLDVYYYAQMLKYNGDYVQAKKYFKRAERSFRRDRKSFEYRKIKQEQMACDKARNMVKDTLPVTVRNMGSTINSTESEFAPFLVNDSTLYFSTLRSDHVNEEMVVTDTNDYFVRIMSAVLENAAWVSPDMLPRSINEKGMMVGNANVSIDGKTLYFSKCPRNGPCSIYASSNKNGKWSKPYPLDEKINKEGCTNTQPMEAVIDGDTYLFFVSDRPNGVGKLDIWYSKKDVFGKFEEPINPGEPVNSIDNEITPFYDTAEKALYFSSEWHVGLGGFDIFRSEGEPGSFKEPENMKPPVNSSANDFYFIRKGPTHIFASNRIGSITRKGATCCNDLYMYKTEEEKLDTVPKPTLSELMKYLPLRLYFHNDEPNPKTLDTLTEQNYLATYRKYEGMRDEYKSKYSQGMSGEDKEDAKEDIDVLFDDYIKRGIENLDQFTPLLLEELKKGKHIQLTIKGYASPLSKTDYNVNLTLRRISSLINYLSEYDGGALLQFITESSTTGGVLSFVKVPFGEFQSETNVSDDYYDTRNSIYNPAAALERRIEIIAITELEDSVQRMDGGDLEKLPVIEFDTMKKSFGNIKLGEEGTVVFQIKNTGDTELKIFQAEPTCNCTEVVLPKSIAPGETGEIKVKVGHKGKAGKLSVDIKLLTNTKPNRKVITVEGFLLSK